jgi:hypothetical protein
MSLLEKTLWMVVNQFERLAIPYAIMGGLAVRIHGLPRPTHDIDFTIGIGRTELIDWFVVAEKEGLCVEDSYKKGWVDNVQGLPLIKLKAYYTATECLDIDIFLAEVDFQKAVLQRRQQVFLNDQSLYVVSPEDLILLKLIAGRPRDFLDIKDILFVQGRLDNDYMLFWAEKYKVENKLQEFLQSPL